MKSPKAISILTSFVVFLTLFIPVSLSAQSITMPMAAVSDAGNIYTATSDGAGNFSGWMQLNVIGSNARGIVIDNFDKDFYPDIITGRSDGDNVYLYKFMGKPDGSFDNNPQAIGTFTGASSWLMDMACGDFNEDGIADFIANTNNTVVAVYLSNQSGGFTKSTFTWTGTGRGMDAGDFNNDGHLDIVRSEYGNGNVSLYLGDGKGSFVFSRIIGSAGSDPYGVVAADFNEDGNLDVIANQGGNGDLTLWTGNGNGTFKSGVRPTGGDVDTYSSMDAFDYNNDGHVDIIESNYSGQQVFFVPGLGNGNFGTSVQISSGSNGTMLSVTALPYRHPNSPIALITPKEQRLSAGASAHFDASSSTGAITSWLWQFDDGNQGTSAVIDNTYIYKGDYWPLLRIKNVTGMWDQARVHAIVSGESPNPVTGGPYVWGEANAKNGYWTGVLDGSSTTNDGGSGAKYIWNFMPDLSFSESFSGTSIDATKWRFANCAQTQGALQVAVTNAGGWGTSYFESKTNYTRKEGLTLYIKYRARASENTMFGFKNTTDNHDYSQLYYAFYPAGTGLNIYEAGSSRGQVRTISYGTWYDFKIELRETGAYYWMKMSTSDAWDLVYQSSYQSGNDLKIGICGYSQGQNDFDNMYLGNKEEGKQVTHSFHGIGVNPVTLTVTDFLDQSSTANTQVTTQALNPPVAITGGPYTFDEHAAKNGQWIAVLNGKLSTDDFGIWKYNWTFGDGVSDTGATPTHAYSARGPYTIKLVVTDHGGLKDSATTTVNFSANQPPVAHITAPASVNESAASANVWTVAMNGSASTDDIGIWKYEWNFGDGSTGSGVSVSHGYNRTGTYTVALTVYDNAGQTATTTQTIAVTANLFPVARIAGPTQANESVAKNQKWTVTFDGRTSSDDFGVWKYEWTFGDGGSSTSANPTYQYSARGNYPVTLKVYDNAGQTHTTTQTIAVVGNNPPVAVINASSESVEGATPVSLDATSSTDDYGISNYQWDLGICNYAFDGTIIDLNAWRTSSNVIQDGRIVMTGTSTWGQRYIAGNRTFGRNTTMQCRVKVPSGSHNAMVGFKNNSDDGNYTQFPHAFYFCNGSFQVYENGSYLGSFGSYTGGKDYDVRIDSKSGAGAIYYYRLSGTTTWTQIYSSTSANTAPLQVGMTVYAGTFELDDMAIHAFDAGPKVSASFTSTTDVILTVTDNAGLTNSTTKTVQVSVGNPPSAVITAPSNFGVGLEVPFSGHSSSDDHGIALYTWNFGDGSSVGYGMDAGHFYTSPGTYTVSLTVTDFAGLRSTASQSIFINGQNIVRTVPWQFSGNVEIPHDCWSGKTVTLKAVASTAALPFSYTWDFGDGSAPASGTITTREESYRLQAQHAYSGSIGTPFTATITVVDKNGVRSSDVYPLVIREKELNVETNVAIDEALWYLHKTQTFIDPTSGSRQGYWSGYSGYKTNLTASAIQSFEINGHLQNGDITQDPYVETVQRAMDYLMTLLTYQNISVQNQGNPDANNNGIAITTTESDGPYQLGAVMDALIASGTPSAVARTGGTNIKGRRYADLVQDMADMYAWGQVDDGGYRGGWRYSWNSDADNSAAQWGAIGMIPAEREWGLTIPQFVKDENKIWTTTSYYNGGSWGGFGYTGPGYSNELSACGLVQLGFNGTTTSDTKWKATEKWYADNWTSFMNSNSTYGFYAFTKAMRLARPLPVVTLSTTGLDWYNNNTNGIRRTLIGKQRADGSWLSSHPYPSEAMHNTAWSVIVLTPTLFVKPPIAIAFESPNPGAVGQTLRFDGSQSYHLDPFKTITSYAWDFNAADGVNWDRPDAEGPTAFYSYGNLGTYTATLRVGDNSVPPIYVTTTIAVNVTIPPHPPTSVPGGPYIASVGEPIILDGSGSFDVDKSQGDSITAYGWEVAMQSPRDFNDATGVKPSNVVYQTAGIYNIGLRVTDNTAVAFPQSGQPNLTNDAYTTVTVSANCVRNLAARAKEIKVTLTWTNNGALPYTVLRSTTGPNSGFRTIGTTSNTYSTFTDYNVEKNIRYYYRVQDANKCLSYAASVVPTTRSVNRRPVITSAPVDTAREGQVYRYQVVASDADGDPLTYILDDGPSGMTMNASGLIQWTPAYSDRGDRPVTIRVNDPTTSTVQYFILHVIPRPNLPPVVSISAPKEGLTGVSLSFDGSGTVDPEGDTPLTQSWSFGDGQTGTGSSTTHTFTASGTYIVTLFATDSRGATGTGTHTIVITPPNRTPSANSGGPYVISALDSATFDGSNSSDPDGDVLTYTWNFGDSKPAQQGAVVKHLFDNLGVYHASLEVTDGRGGSNAAPFDVVVTAADNPPEAKIVTNANYGNVGSEFTFDATASSDPDGDALLFHWTFGDGSKIDGDKVTHIFNSPGHFTVTLSTDDQKGKKDTASTVITINAPPVFTSIPPASANEDSPFIYDAQASDPDIDAITYSLISPRSGMSIDAATGRLFWIPDDPDTGSNQIQIKADDGHGRFTVQTFTLVVKNVNDAPTIVSILASTINEKSAYSYTVTGNDVDAGDVLTYSIVSGPSGMVINEKSGVLTWTPEHSDIGKHTITVKVEDAVHAPATQSVELEVKELPWPPEFTSTPVVVATEHQLYTYQASATDLNSADALTFSVLSAPTGFTIDASSGLATWTPDESGVGQQMISLLVTDGALADTQSYSLTVENVNDPPVIKSTAPVQAAVNVPFTYTIEVLDPDAGDAVTFSIVKGTGNASINVTSGILHWTPAANEIGTQSLTVRATDKAGLYIDQSFTVNVQLEPKPPVFTSTPEVSATEHQLYSYQATADDPNGDALTFALVSGPAGMTVSSNGLVQFTPKKVDVGNRNVTISVTDGNFVVKQDFTIAVAGVNDPPEIISIAPATAVQGALYRYQVVANDPDGDAMRYHLISAPSGMTIDTINGLIQWPEDGSRVDGAQVVLEVSDGKGGVTSQDWTISITADNIPPVVSIDFSNNPASPGSMVLVSINAVDNVGVSRFEMTVDGVTVSPNENHQYYYTADSQGDHVFHTTVYDGAGNAGQANSTLTVNNSADNTPPVVTIDYSPKTVPVGQDVLFTVGASDDKGIDKERIWLKVDDQYIPVDVNGHAHYVPLVKGVVTALATSYDLSGNYGEKQVQFNVNLAGSDNTAPTAAISSPGDDIILTQPADMVGTANDANFAYYTLSYADRDNPQYVEYFRSSTPVNNGVLGKIDPTLLENGIYLFKLTVYDKYGNFNSTTVQAQADGQMKLGNFTLSFSDMKFDFSGINLEVVRTYDSRVKLKKDFGFGWTLGIKNTAKINENRIPGKGWTTQCLKSLWGTCLEWGLAPGVSHIITVQIPGEPKQEFDVDVQTDYADPSGLAQGRLVFKAKPGTYSTLEALDDVEFSFLMGGELLDMEFEPVNPNRYRLTLWDGTKYEIDQALSSVTKITDINNNSVTIQNNTIVHSTGEMIKLNRDADERITSIDDGTGRTIRYTYDGHGNLQTVTDANGNITKFKYEPNHYLTEIIDPRGVRATRTEYDDQGRMVRQINPVGDTLILNYDLANNRETTKDFNGNEVEYTYDARGNVLTKTVYSNSAIVPPAVWRYSYDNQDHLLSTRNPDGTIRSSTWDNRGNELTSTNERNYTTTRTYNEKGQILTKTDALNRTTRYEYDSRGNLVKTIGPDNYVINEMTYAANGNVLTETDGERNITSYGYDSQGKLTSKTDPLRRITRYVLDSRGQTISEINAKGDTTKYAYDASGNQIKITNTLGDSTIKEYNCLNKIAKQTDCRGFMTLYEYDIFGLLYKIIAPDSSFTLKTYDEQRNVKTSTDEVGRQTVFEYDQENRVIKTTANDGSFTRIEYDQLGRKSATIDANGNITEYQYDPAGNSILDRDALGNQTQFEYNAINRKKAIVDALGHRTEYFYDYYDHLNRMEFHDRTYMISEYDKAGRKTAEVDQANKRTEFTYDSVGNLRTVKDAMGRITKYDYDQNDNRIIQTDANNHTTTMEYDKMNRLILRTYPNGNHEHFAYDPNGNQIVNVDGEGDSTVYTYDSRNREILRRFTNSGHIVQTRYTDDGKPDTVIDYNGMTNYRYDNRNRQVSVTNPDGTFIRSWYDAQGNRVAVKTPFDSITYSYDQLNRLVKVMDQSGNTTNYFYNAVGNRDSIHNGNGTSSSYRYDNLNRLINVSNYNKNGLISSYAYSLNNAGIRTAVIEADGSRVDYGYDNLYRLTGETRTGTHPFVTTYTYDNVGNRLRCIKDGVVTNYGYNSRDQLETETNGTTTIYYTYDLAGRLVSKTDASGVTTYRWVDNDRLENVNGSGLSIEYRYDPNGQMISKVTAGEIRKFLIDYQLPYGQVVAEIDGNGDYVAKYVYGIDRISMDRKNEIYTYSTDGQGSIRQLTNLSGDVTDKYYYTAFGEKIAETGTTENKFMYLGEQWDENVKVYYNRARWYNPENGRFTSVDPYGGNASAPTSLHKYLYGNASPVNMKDPSGKFSMGECMASIAIISVLATISSCSYSFFRGAVVVESIDYQIYNDGISGGLTIKLGSKYKNRSPKYPEYRWVQFVTTNDPLGGAAANTAYNDPQPPDDGKPFYWTDAELPNYQNISPYDLRFEDEPKRKLTSATVGNNITWKADLALVGVSPAGSSSYSNIINITYGFQISTTGVTKDPLVIGK